MEKFLKLYKYLNFEEICLSSLRKILRKTELSKLSVLKNKNLIKVVTGVRCAGKSTLLKQFQELLKEEKTVMSF